jgi:hypothetical protein
MQPGATPPIKPQQARVAAGTCQAPRSNRLYRRPLQFGGQAPGTSQEEREWAWRKFGFEFDVFDKIEVNGSGAHPIYRVLKKQQPISLPSSSKPPPGEPGRIEWK